MEQQRQRPVHYAMSPPPIPRKFRDDCECIAYVKLHYTAYESWHYQSDRVNSSFTSLAFCLGFIMGFGILLAFVVIADAFNVQSRPFGAWASYLGVIGILGIALGVGLVLFRRFRREVPLTEELRRECHKKVDEILDRASIQG